MLKSKRGRSQLGKDLVGNRKRKGIEKGTMWPEVNMVMGKIQKKTLPRHYIRGVTAPHSHL